MPLVANVSQAMGCTWFEGTTPEAIDAIHKAVPTFLPNWIRTGVRFNTEYGVGWVEEKLTAAGLTLNKVS